MATTRQAPRVRRHKASGLYYIRVNGKVTYLGRDRAVALQRGRALVAERRVRDEVLSRRRLSVWDLTTHYLKHATRLYRDEKGRPTPELQHMRLALAQVVELYGDLPAVEFGPLKLKAVREQFVLRGNTRKQVNTQVHRIRRAFRWAASEEAIPITVYQALLTVEAFRAGRCDAPEGAPRRPVSQDDFEATLPYMTPTVRAICQLLWFTGCRPSELLAMRPCDLDLVETDVWVYHLRAHKTRPHVGDRQIYLGAQSIAVLEPILLQTTTATDLVFSAKKAMEERHRRARENRKTPIYPSHLRRLEMKRRRRPRRVPGDEYKPHALLNAVKRACEKAKVEPWTPYMIRHAAATRLRRELGLEAARVVLGHTDLRMTQIYAERDQKTAIEIARRMG